MEKALFEQIWPVFSAEAREHLQEIGAGILEIEGSPATPERLDGVRRAAHSLKGSAASLGLEDVERIAHALEDTLTGSAAQGLSRAAVVAGLEAVEALEGALRLGDGGGDCSVPRAPEILAALSAFGARAPPAAPVPARLGEELARLEEHLASACDAERPAERRAEAAGEGAALAARLARDGDVAGLAARLEEAFPRIVRGGTEGARATAEVAGLLANLRKATHAPERRPGDAPADPAAAPAGGAAAAPAAGPRRAADHSIRVLASTIDSLSRRIELFLPALTRGARRGREMIAVEAGLREALGLLERLSAGAGAEDPAAGGATLADARARLAQAAGFAGRLGREAAHEAESQRLAVAALRDELRTLRMVPASLAVEPLRRAVRDAALRLGKQVEITVAGEDVKLDRRVLDELRDPLVHLVRNAVDHGIEAADVRLAAGKPSAGHVAVRVEPRGSRVGIVVEDDGAGLDLDALKASAVRRGAVAEEEAAAMSADAAARLVFLPGLSTAAEVTALSGRGVGLDVVHEVVSRLRGKVDLSFVPGRGTRFDLDLPLTIATTLGIVVRVGRDLAVVPAEAVERVLVATQRKVGTVAGAATVDVDGVQLPFAHLGALLGGAATTGAGAVPALVLAAGSQRAALAVDELVGQQELVVNALGGRAARLAHLAGAAVLDDGRVAAVLSAAELVRRARPAAARKAAATARARLVVADDSLTTRTAMKSLLEVAGYEVFPATDGQEALEIVRQTGCHLVVTDVQMPRLDGLGLTRAIKGDPRLAATPVVLVTSLGAPEDRAAGLAAGADGYLVKKDVQAGKLLELVQQLLPAHP